jgi:SAM-dependent methyltransferase
MNDNFYRDFEDKYRGSRDLIKSKLQVYLPFIKPLLDKKETPKAIDLGCGRGEWLEILIEQGLIAQGVDLDEGMLEGCWELNLEAKKADALEYLQAQESNSIAVISGFHIAEHIAFEMLQELVEQALRVLTPGGLLVLETPNPENIVVGTANFYLDPTHQRPLPPMLLSFIAEHANCARVKILRLQEPEGLRESSNLTLIDVLSGVSPDYSIVAQKTAEKSIIKKFDEAFSKEYGVTLNEISNLYDQQLNNKAVIIQEEVDKLQVSLTEKTRQQQALVASLQETSAELQTVHNSKSWRITWPLRKLMQFFKWLLRLPIRLTLWLIHLPKRTVRWLMVKMISSVIKHPAVKVRAMNWLHNYPNFKEKLRRLAQARGLISMQVVSSIIPIQPILKSTELTPTARHIYHSLKAAIENTNKESR